jgi:hypothetical protein
MQSARCCIMILLRHGLAQKKVWRQRIFTQGTRIRMRRREAYRTELLCGGKARQLPVCRRQYGNWRFDRSWR